MNLREPSRDHVSRGRSAHCTWLQVATCVGFSGGLRQTGTRGPVGFPVVLNLGFAFDGISDATRHLSRSGNSMRP